MALNVSKGVITAPLATGNQTYNLPNGFDPKAIILWSSRQTAAGTGTDAFLGGGFCANGGGSTSHGSLYVYSPAAGTPTNTLVGFGVRNTMALHLPQTAIAAPSYYTATLVSMSNGSPASFVLNWTAVSAAIKVHYLALGGSSITDSQVFSGSTDAINASQSVTVRAGFGQPDLVFFMMAAGTQPAFADQGSASGNFVFGVAKSSTSQQTASMRMTTGVATSAVVPYSAAKLGASYGNTSGAPDEVLTLDATNTWPTDGIAIAKTALTRADAFVGLALKGTFASTLGTFTAPATGSPPQTTALSASFLPSACLVWGNRQTTSTNLQNATNSFGIGATDGTNSGFAGLGQVTGASTPFGSSSYHDESNLLDHYTPAASPTLTSRATASFSGAGATVSFSTVDSVARESNFLLLGDASSGSANRTLLGVGI